MILDLIDVVAVRAGSGRAHRCDTISSLDGVVRLRPRRTHRFVRVAMHNVLGAEVDLVLTELRRLHTSGAPSVGVVLPFRTQADEIEARVLASLPTSAILDLDLRIGTAHGHAGQRA
ncbi:MAG: hypothetical protein V9G18_12915 [Albidovulum sp.]